MIRHLLQQATADGGLARTDLTGQLHKTTAFADAVQQVRQRLTMLLTHIEKARIGRDRKRAFCQSKMLFVHKYFFTARLAIMPFLHVPVPCRQSPAMGQRVKPPPLGLSCSRLTRHLTTALTSNVGIFDAPGQFSYILKISI